MIRRCDLLAQYHAYLGVGHGYEVIRIIEIINQYSE